MANYPLYWKLAACVSCLQQLFFEFTGLVFTQVWHELNNVDFTYPAILTNSIEQASSSYKTICILPAGSERLRFYFAFPG
ncbi:hypothetical protein HA050_09395 [Iodobacter sp. HSC-16F04]|uniref:Uncharacterized protein n=1 Tax=Iodobacter violaceini TaxID=3044271 RepID=A0ABX0L1E2_9NEIS|nr:hypothetical protein [Iodobacter violacea]NHQ86328.1 hypothetical protein [Iodobacter violacea]